MTTDPSERQIKPAKSNKLPAEMLEMYPSE